MASAVIKLSAIFFLIAVCAADVSHLQNAGAAPVTEVCLGCICQAVSGCKQGLTCEGDHCGLFRMTWAYWADAGKPVLAGHSPDQADAYSSCANDPYCAASAVQGYMTKFGQDCNGDGRVDCYDYMAIHKLGGYGCSGQLPYNYVNEFNQCVAAVANAQQDHNHDHHHDHEDHEWNHQAIKREVAGGLVEECCLKTCQLKDIASYCTYLD